MNDTPTNQTTPSKRPFYTRPKFITVSILTVVFLILVLQNMRTVTINVFFMEVQASAVLLYLIFALIGFIVGWLLKRTHAATKTTRK